MEPPARLSALATVFAAPLEAAEVWMIITVLLLLVVLVVLAIAEMGLSRTTPSKAQALAEQDPRRGRMLLRLVKQPERFVNSILLTVNICQTVQATLTGIVAGRLFGVLGVIVGVVLNVVVFFVLAESLPKTWAVLYPDRAALFAARPMTALVAFAPLRVISRGLIGLTNVILPGKGLKQGPFVAEQELLAIVEAAAEDEVIERDERELIESVIEFGDTVAREVMVPRTDMVTVPGTCTVREAVDKLIELGYSRAPVTGEGLDDVIGVAYAKDLFVAERVGHGDEPVVRFAREAKFVPETKQVRNLMREMQAEKLHLAVLIDEYGGVAGLVTLEDLIEELVGDIVDEYDREDAEIERVVDGSEYVVAGSLGIDELADLIDRRVPDDDWDTVGGFVFGLLGHVPVVGEEVSFEGWRLVVAGVEGRRIAHVRVVADPDWSPMRTDDEDEEVAP